MTTALADPPELAFSFLTPTEDNESTAPPPPETSKLAPKARSTPAVEEEADESGDDVLSEIASMLMPTEEQPTNKKAAKAEAPQEEPEPESRSATAKHPVIYNPQLLQLASAEGIGPDEAQGYSSERALFGEIAARKMERQHFVGRTQPKPEAEAEDEFPVPKIEWDEDVDPKIKTAVESLTAYAKAVKENSDRQAAAFRDEIRELRTEHDQASMREAAKTQVTIARMFDEEVSQWGDDFQELIGVPSRTYSQRGTPQYVEVRKLKDKALMLKEGYEVVTGKEATLDDIRTFIREARFALWPDKMQKAARTEIASGLKKQKGGVGLRPGRNRNEEPPEQGDRAARAGIAEKMAEYGLDPWANARSRA